MYMFISMLTKYTGCLQTLNINRISFWLARGPYTSQYWSSNFLLFICYLFIHLIFVSCLNEKRLEIHLFKQT